MGQGFYEFPIHIFEVPKFTRNGDSSGPLIVVGSKFLKTVKLRRTNLVFNLSSNPQIRHS